MKKTILTITISVIFLLTIMTSFVNSEIFLWNDVSVVQAENTTTHHAFYKLDDTSEGFRWRNKGVPVTFDYTTQNLPYALTYGNVDWCNLTIIHYANDYDNDGNYINTTTEVQSYYFNSGVNTGSVTINLKDADEVSGDMKCHYENQNDLYQDNILAGSLTTYLPSYECKGCSEYTLEELSKAVEQNDEKTASELKVYGIVGTLVGLNYRFWLIASWIIKLGLLLVAVGLVFGGVYYLYKFLRDISDRI